MCSFQYFYVFTVQRGISHLYRHLLRCFRHCLRLQKFLKYVLLLLIIHLLFQECSILLRSPFGITNFLVYVYKCSGTGTMNYRGWKCSLRLSYKDSHTLINHSDQVVSNLIFFSIPFVLQVTQKPFCVRSLGISAFLKFTSVDFCFVT